MAKHSEAQPGTADAAPPGRSLGGTETPRREGYDIFHAAVQMCLLPVVLVDPYLPDFPVIYCNQAFCALTGYDESEVLGRNCRFLQGALTDPASVDFLRAGMARRAGVQVEMWNYRKDGTAFWNLMFVGPVTDPQGNVLYWMGSQLATTVRREAEEARSRAQRMDTLGTMAAGIAHEFNNLMTVAVGNIEAVTGGTLSPRQGERLERAEWAVRAAGRLTQQMLSFAQRQSLDMEIVDANSVIGDFDSVLTQIAAGVPLRFALAAEPLLMRLDVGQFELALINLVRNAADAAACGGQISIGTRAAPDAPAKIEITVSDTGSGMPPAVAQRVTEPFFTTKPHGKGTGLGLSMVQGCVQQSGGELLIDSVDGEGTTIRLVFPRHDEAAPAA